MTSDQTSILICCTALGVIFLAGLYWAWHRSHSRLHEWGKANGFEILSHKEHWHFNPEALGQSVYRVTVRDTAGRQRRGTARCETRWLGLLPDEVAVRWDE
ncbi:MAG: hypothetical protein JO332_05505 [Planctomycetaceae bacterium]|nr:hypothetical protein [Planctomycetaceae bacterium]